MRWGFSQCISHLDKPDGTLFRIRRKALPLRLSLHKFNMVHPLLVHRMLSEALPMLVT